MKKLMSSVTSAFCFACSVLLISSPVSAQVSSTSGNGSATLQIDCSSEDDGSTALRLSADSSGNFSGVSPTMSRNTYAKIWVSVNSIGALTKAVKVGAISACVLSDVYNDIPQTCFRSSVVFNKEEPTGFTLFSQSGLRDPEGITCSARVIK